VGQGASEPGGEITRLLLGWRNGEAGAVERIFPLVYNELRVLARHQLRKRPGSLASGSLVHEAYVRFVDQTQPDFRDRNHFFAVASQAMRCILIDHARARCALKRGGGAERAALDERAAAVEARAEELLVIDEALSKLEALDPRLVEIVQLRFFGGLSVEETAAALDVSERTVKRDWQKARALLRLELSAPRG